MVKKELFEFANLILSKDYYNSSNIIDLDECKKLINKHKNEYFDP